MVVFLMVDDQKIVLMISVEPPSKRHFGISHFVLCSEVVLFSEVKNVREKGPKERPLLGGCPFLGGFFLSEVPLYKL